MNRSARAVVIATVMLLPAVAAVTGAQEPRKITVVARKYEFQPRRIELKAGEPVEITFESEDTKHGFSCKELKLDKVTFSKDHPQSITFTPAKGGTYEFRCARFCGLGHRKMRGEIVVTP